MKLLSSKEYEELKRKNKKDWLKYCFDICETYNWNAKKIKNISTSYGYLTEMTFINNGKKYIEEYLKLDLYSKNDPLVPGLNTKYNSTLNKLIYIENEEEITELIQESKCDLTSLRNKIPGFIRLYMNSLTEDEQKELTESLENKIKKESKRREKERKEKVKLATKERIASREKEKIMLIESAFKEVLRNEITEKQLIKQISRASYKRYLEILKEYSPEFYNKYIKKLEKDKQKRELMQKELNIEIENLYNNIVNGIDTEEGLREFDVVDYYKLYRKYNNYILDYIRNNEQNLGAEKITVLKKFYSNILYDEALNAKKIIEFKETIFEFDCKQDRFGFLIPNSGITISLEEKEKMLKYLKDNKIPITNKSIRALINRYKNKALNKSKVKTRKPNN